LAGYGRGEIDWLLSFNSSLAHMPDLDHSQMSTMRYLLCTVVVLAAIMSWQNSVVVAQDDEMGYCKTCVFVLERIKKGSNLLLPAICSELYMKFPKAYQICHQVLNALSLNGENVRYWLFEGCYKYERYKAKEWITPCPSHVMCSVLNDLTAAPFCNPLPMEDPFAEERPAE